MRFLGNKSELLEEIKSLLREKNLLNCHYTLFDAFCGTGSVSNFFKNQYRIIINDNLEFATIYSKGRIVANDCNFKKLGFNPINFLNNSTEIREGFFFQNYSPSKTNRKYFTSKNAARIDFFRETIEGWKNNNLLSSNEYSFLIASLIESVSLVSNTAGVYGAFLKHWDRRALNDIVFVPVESNNQSFISLDVFNDKIENIIGQIKCDILYLDPPYTQNQYGTQYHLLETLVKNDCPEISKITGSRPTTPMRSDWSKDIKSHILFDKIIAETKARYIVFSYNNDGFMSKEYIEACLKRYGVTGSYLCKKIPYKKYENWKSKNEKKHFEYLFFVEKKHKDEIIYESPLNYMGSKAKLVPFIKKFIPYGRRDFYDLFAGGFNVGINSDCKKIIYNDINPFITGLIRSFYEIDTYEYIRFINSTIKKYNLFPHNEEGYKKIRETYNAISPLKRSPKLLYVLVLYGFQQQLRFNSDFDFNNPVGLRWFNDKLLEKFISFSRKIKEIKPIFSSINYFRFDREHLKNSVVYLDPPYSLTNGSYNDGKRGFNGWDDNQEKALLSYIDLLNSEGITFILSYVIEHEGRKNIQVQKWIEKKGYKKEECPVISGISGKKRKEVIIYNHEILL